MDIELLSFPGDNPKPLSAIVAAKLATVDSSLHQWLPHSDQRHSLVAGKLRDALFSAFVAKYTTDDSDPSLPFPSEKLKSNIVRRLHEYFPSFHTPTHLPYASMIQRAIAEVGEEDGLSEESISDFIVNEYKDLPWAHTALLHRHLGKLCESGELVKSKCGRYNFDVEDKGVKRKRKRRKSVGRSRRQGVESADEIEDDFDGKDQSKKLIILGPRALEVVTSKGTEEQNGSLREEIVGVEDGDQAGGQVEVLDELEEVQEDEMIDKCLEEEIKNNNGPEDFDLHKQSQNLVILGLCAPGTIKGIEEQSGSLGKEVRGAEEGDRAKGGQLRKDVRIERCCAKEVESRDVVRDFDKKKQSQNLVAANLFAKDALLREGTEEKCGLSREETGAEEGHTQESQVRMIYELKVGKVGMRNGHHKVKGKSGDGAEDFCGKEQSHDLLVVGLRAKEAPTTKGSEEQCSLLSEKIDRAEGDGAQVGQTEVLDKLKEVQEVEMIKDYHEEEGQRVVMEEPIERASAGSNGEELASEEANLEFFDAMSNHANAEKSELIDAQCCKKLREEKEDLEFFDAKSDHGADEANEMIDAQSSKGKVLSEVNDQQNRLQEQLLSKRQTDTLKHAEQGSPSTSEAHVICGHKSQPSGRGRRGRGRPRKLNVQETLAASFSSFVQDCSQQHLESNIEDKEASDPDTGNGTHHVDQQRLQKLSRGRGRGRGRGQGRGRVAKQDQISLSDTFSTSKHLHHQQSPEKRRPGRPPKHKFDDVSPKDITTSLENEQPERKCRGRGRGRGRPPREREQEK